jgi:hypothetical protein
MNPSDRQRELETLKRDRHLLEVLREADAHRERLDGIRAEFGLAPSSEDPFGWIRQRRRDLVRQRVGKRLDALGEETS